MALVRTNAQTVSTIRGDVMGDDSVRDSVERFTMNRRGESSGGSRFRWLSRIVGRIKSVTDMMFVSRPYFSWGSEKGMTSRDGTFDYRTQVGTGRNNAIVMAAIELASTAFAQSPMQVMKRIADSDEVVPDHELTALIRKPNPWYSGKLMWQATIADYMFGNAYWMKVRSGAGKPVELYWVPSILIKPCWPQDDPTVFISHYEYNPNGTILKIDPKDVVHFRNGIDPYNVRMGLSKLGALLREISTDDEAAEYANTILRNLGVAGMVISPLNEKVRITEPDAEKIKARTMARTSGDRRGEPLVLGGAVRVDGIGTDPSKMDLAAIRHVPEERITSIFSTPAILLGLGTGLEHGTYNNLDGLRKIYYENKLIPMQELIAADIDTQLLVDYAGEKNTTFATEFNNDKVRVLKEDETQLVTRIVQEMEHGILTANEARQLRNREALEEDFFALAGKVKVVAVDEILAPEAPTVVGTDGKPVPVDSAGNPLPIDPAASANATAAAASDSSTATGSGGSGNNNTTNGKSRVDTKDVADSVVRIRTRMSLSVQADVQKYLDEQKQFVLEALAEQQQNAQGKAAAGAATPRWRVNWPRLQEDVDALKSVLEPWYKRVLVAVHDVVQDALSVRYELSGTEERTYVKNAGLNIKGIAESTRLEVSRALKASMDLDESYEELTLRIERLGVFDSARSELIARTELATATNLAQLESYKASDIVVGVLVSDGDSDDVCSAMDGTMVPINEVRSIPPLGHPNCVRKFSHITDVNELSSSSSSSTEETAA